MLTLLQLADIADELKLAQDVYREVEGRYVAALKGRLRSIIEEAVGPVSKIHVHALDPERHDWIFTIRGITMADGTPASEDQREKVDDLQLALDNEMDDLLHSLRDHSEPSDFFIP